MKEASIEIVDIVTQVMREADQRFQTTGGSTRHYARDLLLPMLQEHGYEVVKSENLTPNHT